MHETHYGNKIPPHFKNNVEGGRGDQSDGGEQQVPRHLISSPVTSRASNSVTHFVSMTCKREKNVGSVRSSRHVIQGWVYMGFLHLTVLVDAQALAKLISSPVTCRASNSVTHFVSMTSRREKNLGSVRSSRHVIQGWVYMGFLHLTVLVDAQALARLFYLHVQLQTQSNSCFQ